MVKAENRARPAVIFFLLNKAPRRGKKCVLKSSQEKHCAAGIFLIYIFATSLKDRLARWLVMASDIGPRDLKARGSTFCCK